MLNTRVLSLCVFTDKNSIDIIIWCLVSGNGNTWPNVGKKVECPSKGQVKGNVALSDFPVIISTGLYGDRRDLLGVAKGPLDSTSEMSIIEYRMCTYL